MDKTESSLVADNKDDLESLYGATLIKPMVSWWQWYIWGKGYLGCSQSPIQRQKLFINAVSLNEIH